MRIALRTSGGRGDYELAGTYNKLSSADLFEKRFLFQVTPSLVMDGRAEAHLLAGKPRIRPHDDGRHPYLVLSAVLLLPPPRRELRRTGASGLMLSAGAYAVAGIDVEVVDENKEQVLFNPKSVWAKSLGGLLKIDFAERMALIAAAWAVAETAKGRLADLLRSHAHAVEAGDHGVVIDVAKELQRFYRSDEDILPELLRDFGLSGGLSADVMGSAADVSEFATEDDKTRPDESRMERAIKWRKQVDRGPGAREFSNEVRAAYDFRCVISGERLPKFDPLGSAGVDGAHILPWSKHRLNAVTNGLCLCKLCHWAFDNGVLRLDFDVKKDAYLLSIPKAVDNGAMKSGFDLGRFRSYVGAIPGDRLPKNRKIWPAPTNLEEWNSNFA